MVSGEPEQPLKFNPCGICGLHVDPTSVGMSNRQPRHGIATRTGGNPASGVPWRTP